jgi:hypothetical protein
MCAKERNPSCSGSLNISENVLFDRNTDILNVKLLGAFKKLRKATISLALRVRPSVRMEKLGFRWTYLH